MKAKKRREFEQPGDLEKFGAWMLSCGMVVGFFIGWVLGPHL